MTQVTLNNRRHGLPDAVDARHQCSPDQDAAQCSDHRQDAHRARQRVPETLLQRHIACDIASDQQVVAAGKSRVHQRDIFQMTAHRQLDDVGAGRRWHVLRPRRHVACHWLHRRVGQQQQALTRDLHANAVVDVADQARSALAAEHIGETQRIGLQNLVASVLDRDTPCVP